MGNPPYRRLKTGEIGELVGDWMDELWDDLKEPVRGAGWANQLNTFPELSVAFWRWAIWKIFESEGAPGRRSATTAPVMGRSTCLRLA
jgi:hypothetical protein